MRVFASSSVYAAPSLCPPQSLLLHSRYYCTVCLISDCASTVSVFHQPPLRRSCLPCPLLSFFVLLISSLLQLPSCSSSLSLPFSLLVCVCSSSLSCTSYCSSACCAATSPISPIYRHSSVFLSYLFPVYGARVDSSITRVSTGSFPCIRYTSEYRLGLLQY